MLTSIYLTTVYRLLGVEDYVAHLVYLGVSVVFRLHARRDAIGMAIVGVFWLEELTYIGLTSAFQHAPEDLRQGVFALAVMLGGFLLTGLKLPDRLLPLRGVWLRRLLATATVIGLAQLSWEVWPVEHFPIWVSIPSAVIVVWAASPAVYVLSEPRP